MDSLDRFMAFDDDDKRVVDNSVLGEQARLARAIFKINPASAKSAQDLMPPGFRLNERKEIEIVGTGRTIASKDSGGSSKVDCTDTPREEETRRILSSLSRVERNPFDL